MTGALLRKELGQLKPWAILSVVLGLAEFVSHLIEPPDMRPLEQAAAALDEMDARMYWLIAFAIGTGLGTREAEDGTLAFLDGLPVSRSRVYWLKCGLTWALLSLGPWLALASLATSHALSHGSLDQDARVDILLGRFALQLGVIAGGLLLGSALGWLRSLAWLCLGVLSTALNTLTERVPRTAALRPFALIDAPISSAPFHVDTETLLTQLAIMALTGAIGWLAFLRAGRAHSSLDLRGRPVLGALVSTLTLIVLAFALKSMIDRDVARKGKELAEADEAPRFVSDPPAESVTRYYRFSYPAANSEAAQALIARADAIYERTHQLLGVPYSGTIDVDGSGSLENTDGTAYLGRVRISLLADDPARVLGHETAHVIARRLAGDERAVLWQRVRVLDEGLASWVEHQLQAAGDQRKAARLVLAALHARGELSSEELVEPDRLALVRDENLKYPAGEAIIAAIVRLHGAAVLPRMVRAFATSSLPTELTGAQLWQATFQLAGIDPGKVFDELFREVAQDMEARRDEIAALPRFRLRLVRDEEGAIGLQVLVEPEGAEVPRLFVRFKPEPESSLDQYETYEAEPDELTWREPEQLMNGLVCAQAGLWLPPDQILYEPWACLPTAGAEPWSAEE